MLLIEAWLDKWWFSLWDYVAVVSTGCPVLLFLDREEEWAGRDRENSTRDLTGAVGVTTAVAGVGFVITWLLGDSTLVAFGGAILVITGLVVCYGAWGSTPKGRAQLWCAGPSSDTRTWEEGEGDYYYP